MAEISARFRIRRVTGGDAAPSDHLNAEIAVAESGHSFWYGYSISTGSLAAASHLLFRSDGTRLWHSIIGAADGSTEFVGDGTALTGVTASSVAWSDVTGKPELGDAALATLMSSSTDSTSGRVLALIGSTGAFGIGASYAPLLANIDDTATPAGLYLINMASGTSGTGPGFSQGALIVAHAIGAGTKAPQQIAIERTSGAGKMAWRTSQGGTLGPWQTVAAIGHAHAISDVSGLEAALSAKQPSVTSTDAALTSGVDLASNNAWTDAVTLSLAAGTWMLTGQITMQRAASSAVVFQGRLTDGTVTYASGQQYQASNTTNNATTITLHRVVTLASSATIRLQGLCVSGANGSDNRIIAQLTTNAAGDTATILTAVKIA